MSKQIHVHIHRRQVKDASRPPHDPRRFANRSAEYDYLSKIPPADRTPEEKERLKKILSTAMMSRKPGDATPPYLRTTPTEYQLLDSKGRVHETYPRTAEGKQRAELDKAALNRGVKDARSKAEIENDLDDVQEEIEKLEDRGQTVPAALHQKRERLQKEYTSESESVKKEYRADQMTEHIHIHVGTATRDADPAIEEVYQALARARKSARALVDKLTAAMERTSAGRGAMTVDLARQVDDMIRPALHKVF